MIHNVADVEVTVRLDGKNSRFTNINYDSSGEGLKIENGELRIPAWSSVVLKAD